MTDPSVTQDNPHLGKPSTTTGEPMWGARTAEDVADRAWLRQLGLDVEARTPAHRSTVLWTEGYRFKVHCRTCGWLLHPDKLDKGALEEFARAHEAEFANA